MQGVFHLEIIENTKWKKKRGSDFVMTSTNHFFASFLTLLVNIDIYGFLRQCIAKEQKF